MKICSFNVNSIRTRKELIVQWYREKASEIDIFCFQETKVIDKDFPFPIFVEVGLSCECFGQKSYNGVAICSSKPLTDIKKGFGEEEWDYEKRLILGRFKQIWIINIYAPRGGERGSDKFYYKLNWFKHFKDFLSDNFKKDDKIIIVGDMNVARNDIDVFDPVLMKDHICTMPEEREAFEDLLSWGLVDSFRYLYPDKQQFTWWDYIGGAIWKNEGMRLDYILCSEPLKDKIKDVIVDLWPRRRRTPKPSDHAPIIAEFDI